MTSALNVNSIAELQQYTKAFNRLLKDQEGKQRVNPHYGLEIWHNEKVTIEMYI